jgi:hypothetical protein
MVHACLEKGWDHKTKIINTFFLFKHLFCGFCIFVPKNYEEEEQIISASKYVHMDIKTSRMLCQDHIRRNISDKSAPINFFLSPKDCVPLKISRLQKNGFWV